MGGAVSYHEQTVYSVTLLRVLFRYCSEPFHIKVVEAHDLSCGKLFGVGVLGGRLCIVLYDGHDFNVWVRPGIFLGDRLIGSLGKTRWLSPQKQKEGDKTQNLTWKEQLEFDIKLQDLPRDAKLCLAIVGIWNNPAKLRKKRKNYRNEEPLAWVNMSVFNHKRDPEKAYLRRGVFQLTTWFVRNIHYV